MNKQVKILENKRRMIDDSIADLTKQLNERANTLLRGDAIYQAFNTKLQMERVRINDVEEFLNIIKAKPVKEKKKKEKE